MISVLKLEHGCICLGIPSMSLTLSALCAAQATKTSLAYCAAVRQAVKAQGDAQLLILNPGNVLDKGLAKQVHCLGHCSGLHPSRVSHLRSGARRIAAPYA